MLTIEITQSDIDSGVPHDVCKCVIADAVSKATNLNAEVANCHWISLYDSNDKCVGELQIAKEHEAIVQQFINDFDSGIEVKPFKFECKTVIYSEVEDEVD